MIACVHVCLFPVGVGPHASLWWFGGICQRPRRISGASVAADADVGDALLHAGHRDRTRNTAALGAVLDRLHTAQLLLVTTKPLSLV